MNNGVNQRSQLVVFQFPEDGDLSNSGDDNYMDVQNYVNLPEDGSWMPKFEPHRDKDYTCFPMVSQQNGHLDCWFICVSIFCTFPMFMTSIMIRMMCFSFKEKTYHKFVQFCALSRNIPNYIHVFFPVSSCYYHLVD